MWFMLNCFPSGHLQVGVSQAERLRPQLPGKTVGTEPAMSFPGGHFHCRGNEVPPACLHREKTLEASAWFHLDVAPSTLPLC